MGQFSRVCSNVFFRGPRKSCFYDFRGVKNGPKNRGRFWIHFDPWFLASQYHLKITNPTPPCLSSKLRELLSGRFGIYQLPASSPRATPLLRTSGLLYLRAAVRGWLSKSQISLPSFTRLIVGAPCRVETGSTPDPVSTRHGGTHALPSVGHSRPDWCQAGLLVAR